MERKSSRSAAVILTAVLGLLIAYPLSAGPAYALCETPEPIWDMVYGPLGRLPKPIVDALDAYVLFCDRIWRGCS
jgi:hypothetical protein